MAKVKRFGRPLASALGLVAVAASTLATGANTVLASSSTSTARVAGIDVVSSSVIPTVVAQIGHAPALINSFFGFEDSTGQTIPFPSNFAGAVISQGSTPMITWLPQLANASTTSVLTTIANGSLDAYITSWAHAAKAQNHRIYVRLMHEFDGDWYPWGTVVAGVTPLPGHTGTYPYTNTPAMYVAAFRHVVDLFKAAGANNVEFVWCVATSRLPSNLASYYPGDSYVAWPSMDGYNRSATTPRTLYQIFDSGYRAITAITAHPIMIAETASVEYSGLPSDPTSKAQWITDSFLQSVPSYFPQIRAVNYFDMPGGGGYSYAIDSSPATESAIRQVFSTPSWEAPAP